MSGHTTYNTASFLASIGIIVIFLASIGMIVIVPTASEK
jgi:hypothetical protein